MSSERAWAERAAEFYGPRVARMSRAERIDVLRAKIAELERSIAEQNEAHLASCETCQRAREKPGQNPFDNFCFYGFELETGVGRHPISARPDRQRRDGRSLRATGAREGRRLPGPHRWVLPLLAKPPVSPVRRQ